MATTYKGVTLPYAKVSIAGSPRQWQLEAFPMANGEVAFDMGGRPGEVTVNGQLRDVAGSLGSETTAAAILALNDGTAGTLVVAGMINEEDVIIVGGIDFGAFMTVPSPAVNATVVKAAQYQIRFRRLSG